ncbi:hypothetical protein CORC01_05397 [Colletotrichum orchidophilum]|uniref:Uncharacterized protein n=1 Tax=Colletotrichum orchidophilum TaxID=1209926 RepID=A0A1G4BDE9_9PEZI|nr:uncharacterized protein CORC01_05397 [Colletotrichum orchidophilum]OHE99356.1 hypothetical protein CORC01_05397 [Colletotrichum orchidophilum]
MYVGAHFRIFHPREIFLTFGKDGQRTPETVRPVLLDYSLCVVWSQTRDSTHGRLDALDFDAPPIPRRYIVDKHPLQRLPAPPHPLWKYDMQIVDPFKGWFPVDWKIQPEAFHVWVTSEFGDPEREGVYSTRETLDKTMRALWEEGQRTYEMEKPRLISEGRHDLIIDVSEIHPTPKEKLQAEAKARHDSIVTHARMRRELYRGSGWAIPASLDAACEDPSPP